jgi:hypothetical protein
MTLYLVIIIVLAFPLAETSSPFSELPKLRNLERRRFYFTALSLNAASEARVSVQKDFFRTIFGAIGKSEVLGDLIKFVVEAKSAVGNQMKASVLVAGKMPGLAKVCSYYNEDYT